MLIKTVHHSTKHTKHFAPKHPSLVQHPGMPRHQFVPWVHKLRAALWITASDSQCMLGKLMTGDSVADGKKT